MRSTMSKAVGFTLALMLCLSTVGFGEPEASPTFSGPAKELHKEMENLFELSKKVNSTDAAVKTSSRERIDKAMDWERIAKDCLGDAQWKKQSAGNREEFKKLLKDVIIRTAYTRLDKFWPGVTYQFDKIDVKGNTAFIASKFLSKTEPIVLEYYANQKGGKWSIYDISYEGERYSVNINQQIDAFLKEKPFNELLSKLRKRRDDLIRDEAKAGKKA